MSRRSTTHERGKQHPGALLGRTKHSLLTGDLREELEKSQAELRVVSESSADLIWTVDANSFRLKSYNRALKSFVFDHGAIKVRSRMSPQQLLPAELVDKFVEFYTRALKQGDFTIEQRIYPGTLLHLSFQRLVHKSQSFGIWVRGREITKHQQPNGKLPDTANLPFSRPDWFEEFSRGVVAPSDGNGQNGSSSKRLDLTGARRTEGAMRELSQRLIHSQEEERRRVARELHDNIGQELALAAMLAERIDLGRADRDQTPPGELHQLYEKIKEIAIKVNGLSHQLHSSELEYLGLRVAAQRLTRDFASQFGIEVDIQTNNVPHKLRSDIALTFYRILQEALRNAARHSNATKISVHITSLGSELSLMVADNGTGFNVHTAKPKSGLGLISMRERMRSIGGQLAITSKVGTGTILEGKCTFRIANGTNV